MDLPIPDRTTAGHALAEELRDYKERDNVIVLGLPRGGLPVAYEIARALGAELDLMLVRKLGTPGQEELAMGAIASGGIRVLNSDVVRMLDIDDEAIDQVAEREQRELERREQAYRGQRPYPDLRDRCVILVDDGLATGATMRAAVRAVRKQSPAEIVVAVPVAPADTVAALRSEVDTVICPHTPANFMAIGAWYIHFPQVSDDEVKALLSEAWA